MTLEQSVQMGWRREGKAADGGLRIYWDEVEDTVTLAPLAVRTPLWFELERRRPILRLSSRWAHSVIPFRRRTRTGDDR